MAHRGDPYRHRENTLPSLRSALREGADAVEIDVRLTRDGRPVLLHDATLKRLWGHDRALAEVAADELSALTDGGVPALAEALDVLLRASASARILVDLPNPAAARAVVAEVRAAGAAERTYYCGGTRSALAVRAAAPDAEIALSWTTVAGPRPALLDDVRPRWLNLRFGLADEELVTAAHARGLLVSAWTADTRRTMERLLCHGVDALTTNRIGVLRRVVDG
ncbi:glycerophosphodiester phosphodiesterase [Streptomyces sp. MTZ3.1]|uniref:Glycerophosphodiester phosphodiesterase n=1 Tax=Streptomyces meridianus TaxID=2938945 RepID=A0ABT0X8N6_9ACTN|nr:glycerophosphodiester phosphodiesterase [Streptomyces meridianus]MCM2578887.1 glycerophosphodiester phosphodiesterase [Streptomyces meridianus]